MGVCEVLQLTICARIAPTAEQLTPSAGWSKHGTGTSASADAPAEPHIPAFLQQQVCNNPHVRE